MSINTPNPPPQPPLKLFQYLIFKIQGQNHGWDQSSKSQSGSHFLSNHIPSVPCQTVLPFLGNRLLNLTMKIQGQVQRLRSYCWSNIISIHIPFISCYSTTPFLKYSLFSKFDFEVMGEVKVQSHNICPTPYWFTSLSFHFSCTQHCVDMFYRDANEMILFLERDFIYCIVAFIL